MDNGAVADTPSHLTPSPYAQLRRLLDASVSSRPAFYLRVRIEWADSPYFSNLRSFKRSLTTRRPPSAATRRSSERCSHYLHSAPESARSTSEEDETLARAALQRSAVDGFDVDALHCFAPLTIAARLVDESPPKRHTNEPQHEEASTPALTTSALMRTGRLLSKPAVPPSAMPPWPTAPLPIVLCQPTQSRSRSPSLPRVVVVFFQAIACTQQGRTRGEEREHGGQPLSPGVNSGREFRRI